MKLARTNLHFAAALAVAGIGCLNVDDGATTDRPAPAIGTNVHPSLASATAVIEVGRDEERYEPFVVLDADAEETPTEGVAKTWRDPMASYVLLARKELGADARAKLGAIENTRVYLHDDEGRTCEGLLGAPFVLGRSQDEAAEPPLGASTNDDADETAWTSTSGGRAIVAPLLDDACVRRADDDGWVAASATPLARIEVHDADEALTNALLADFRTLPEWRSKQHDFEDWTRSVEEKAGDWDARGGQAPVVSWATFDGARRAWVSASTGDGCGDFTASLLAIYVERDGRWVLESTRDDSTTAPHLGWITPKGVAWSLFGGGVDRPENGARKTIAPEIAFHGCPC